MEHICQIVYSLFCFQEQLSLKLTHTNEIILQFVLLSSTNILNMDPKISSFILQFILFSNGLILNAEPCMSSYFTELSMFYNNYS